MFYNHTVLLTYNSSEELNRHMRRLIEREEFLSMGQQPDFSDGKKVYGFCKYITEEDFNRLGTSSNKEIQILGKNLMRVLETRQAW